MGFWGTLAKIGGMAAGAIPGVGPAISLGLNLGTGIGGAINQARGVGGGSGGGGNPTQKSPYAPSPELMADAEGSSDATQAAKGYNTTILNGSQEATQSLLGGDVSTILSQYDNAAKAAEEFGPRGGGRASVAAELPFQKVAAYGKLLGAAKPKAVDSLATIGNQETGQKNQLLATLLSKDSADNRLQIDKDKQSADQWGGLGESLGDILARVINNKKGGGGWASAIPMGKSKGPMSEDY